MILFEGNRVMLFRTALALMDLYGNADTVKLCQFAWEIISEAIFSKYMQVLL